MAISDFKLETGLQVSGSAKISGSVSASQGFTGSLYGTASYGQDSNLLDGLDSTAFARLASANTFSQTQTISGNLYVTGTVSASVVTASQGFVSGGLTIGDYVQLLPVGATNIPTNLTASYIYTSGSTNDMYFTQYQGPYTNTTRLRWLESTLSTGLLHGGILSTVNGTTTFSVSSGSGLILNYNASTGSDPYPTINFVSWPTYTSQSLLYSGSAPITYIAIASDGTISQETLPPNFSEFKDRIVLGRVLHQSGSVTNGATNTPPTAYGLATSTADFIRAIGPLKISGHFLAPSGSGNLSLTKSAGDSYVEGRNYSLNPNIPNLIISANDPAVTVSKIYRQRCSGGIAVIDTGVAGAGYTTVDPTLYQDANGNLASVGTDFTVQRVYWFPRAVNRALYVYYGQATYANIDDAIAGINTENFVECENTKGSAILVAHLVMKGNISNFDSSITSRIYQAGLFRGGAGGGGGGGGSSGATNLASLTDVSIGTPANGQALIYNTSISKWVEGYPNSASYATNTATASYVATGSAIATFTNDVRNQFSVGSNIGISAGVVSLSSSVSTTAVTGTTGVSGAIGLFPILTGSSLSGTTAQFTTISGSNISGALIGTLNGFTGVVAGTNLTSSTLLGALRISLTSSVTSGLTLLTSTSGNFTILSGTTTTGSTALFTTVTGTTTTGSTATFTRITGSTITGSTLSYTTLNTTQMTSSGKILVDNGLKIGNGANSYATNIGIGDSALASINNPVGVDNVAIGYQALVLNQSGNQNIAIGKYALYNTNGSYNNVAIGGGAGQANTNGAENIFVGAGAGNQAKASFNTLIGTNAGVNLVSSQNTAIGYYALNAHKGTGGNNFALGTYAVQTVISGTENVGIGINTIYGITNGDFNIAIGSRAIYPSAQGYNNVTSSYNTAIGYNALSTIAAGGENLSIGYNGLLNLISGSQNNGVGTAILGSLKTGSANTAVGYKGLLNLISGSNNIGIGNYAGSSILTGSGNVIIGSATGINNTDNNIYISDGAGNLRLQVDSNGALSGTVITGSSITGSTVLATVVTGTTTTGSTALFTTITGSTITGSTALYTVVTGTTTTGSTATFTTISGSNISGALIGTLNTISVINASTNLTASNVGSIRSLALTSSITNGLTRVTGVETGSFTYLTGTTTTGTLATFGTVSGSTGLSGALGLFTTLTASNISSSGNMTLGGNITLSNAGGIVFGTTAGASSGTLSSNTLSDYEIGSWTPAYQGTGWTYNSGLTVGRYTKIGKIVHLEGSILLTATGSNAPGVVITGIPFTSNGNTYGDFNVIRYQSLAAGITTYPQGYVGYAANTITLEKASNTLLVTDLTNASWIWFSAIYTTTS